MNFKLKLRAKITHSLVSPTYVIFICALKGHVNVP